MMSRGGMSRQRRGKTIYVVCTCGQAVYKYRSATATAAQRARGAQLAADPRMTTVAFHADDWRTKSPPGENCRCWELAHEEGAEAEARSGGRHG